MDWLTFIAAVVKALAWPSVVMVLLIIIKPQLRGMAERLIEFSAPGGWKAKFREALETGRAEVERTATPQRRNRGEQQTSSFEIADARVHKAEKSPEATIFEAYDQVAEELKARRTELNLDPRSNLPTVVRALVASGRLDPEAEPLFLALQQARNAVAHLSGGSRATPGEALEFAEQAELLMLLLNERAFEGRPAPVR